MSCPLVRLPDPAPFAAGIRRWGRQFACYAATSPAPLPAAGLVVSPEIRYQSELYLPITHLRLPFYRLYRHVLAYPPILTSTPFHRAPSWADCYALLPDWLQVSPNPAHLLQRLLADAGLLTRFIFYSFLPGRFNGAGFERYPDQLNWLRTRFSCRAGGSLRILDAACGSGEGAWELAELLAAQGWQPAQVQITGWTLEPLEVWAAQQHCLPHDPLREQRYQQRVHPLRNQGWSERVIFQTVDLLADLPKDQSFDLILCNGLLGGPLMHRQEELQRVIGALAARLRPGGRLLAAHRFHDGWQRQVPQSRLIGLFRQAGVVVQTAGEGIAGQRSRP